VFYPSPSKSVLAPDAATTAIAVTSGVPGIQWLSPSSLERWLVFAAALFLVSVPVFLQAPLVRIFPWGSLLITPLFLFTGQRWLGRADRRIWGDLLIGFAWTWLAGSVYWGWFREEPFLHLPLEAVGLPFALRGIWRGGGRVGNFFYLGSLLGTAITDLYFYLVNLIPHWRSLMQVPPDQVEPIFQSAIVQVMTPWGIAWAMLLTALLLFIGILSSYVPQAHWRAFSGAVLSTILVDSLFWVAACLA